MVSTTKINYHNTRAYLVKSTAAVDGLNYFEQRTPWKMVLIISHPKTFKNENKIKHDLFLRFLYVGLVCECCDQRHGWYPLSTG